MTKTQQRRYNMALAVLRFCLAHLDILNLNLAFKKAVTKLGTLTDAVSLAVQGQAQDTRGVQDVKMNLKDTLVFITAQVSALLFAYATDKGDAALKAKAGWKDRDLERLNESELPEIAENLVRDATPAASAADAAEYGLSLALLTNLKSAIGAYREGKDAPRNATANRSTETRTLEQTMSATSRHLRESMDKLVEFYKKTHPEFYNTYKENRKVMDVASRKKADTPGA